MIDRDISSDAPVIGWWSGGITSAVACKIAVNLYGPENCKFLMLDTMNEHEDTYRFKKDCEQWYERPIEMIRNEDYDSIEDVWDEYKSLNVAHGAICSSTLKKDVRTRWEKENEYSYQVFGFGSSKREVNRARSLKLNYPDANPIFPLLMYGMIKEDCITYVQDMGIEIPATYKLGLENNNCWQTGCVQGGIGYWQWMRDNQPEKFDDMADREHRLTDRKGEPVTISKDQSKEAMQRPKEMRRVFLKKHPDYPELKDISQIDGREPKNLIECNGLCGLDDLNGSNEKSEANEEIFIQASLFN